MVSNQVWTMIQTEIANKAVYEHLVQPVVLVGSGLLYVVIALLLHYLMRDRSPFSLKQTMRVYNVIQVAVCGYMTYGLLQETSRAQPVVISGITLPNVFALAYQPTKRSEYFVLVHYLSKFLDFFDTLFIVLRKKDSQFSFLHVYHHATIGPIWGLLLYLDYGAGTAIFGALINSFTHVLMYSHYFVTSFGIRNPFKKAITSWQIFQFYACLTHAVVVVLGYDNFIPYRLAVLQLCYHITMVVLFNQFFTRTFAKPASANGKVAAVSNPDMATTTTMSPNGNGTAIRRRIATSD
eukprot:m.81821 g.81821  ORF g.81821 m.81821 type:complete len:294 (-) comp14582_c0_seq1:856-1737(-)